MNSRIFTVLATTLALGATAFATKGSESKAAAQVAFNEPEHFADFRMSESYRKSDAEILQKEISKEIERFARAYLPPGYTLNVRFTDIDLAGDVNPYHQPQANDVRIYKGIYTPRLTFDYTVTDADGNAVSSGTEKLIDMAYEMRVRMPGSDYTRIETDMLRDFISSLGNKIAKGTA